MDTRDASKDAARYFEPPPPAPEGAVGVWHEVAEIPPLEFVGGIRFQPVLGDGMLVNFITWEPHTVAPVHAHEEEQIVFVLEGEFEFECGGETRLMRPGTVLRIPAHVPHGARTRDSRCVQVDVFCPPRRVLVEAMQASG